MIVSASKLEGMEQVRRLVSNAGLKSRVPVGWRGLGGGVGVRTK